MIKNLSVYASNKTVINKQAVHNIVAFLKNKLGFSIFSLQYNFVTPEEIRYINKKYLKHDFTTDIITFNYSGKNDILEGEIFISVEDALANSNKFKVSLDNELVRLIIHGILHLIGFDDKNETDRKKMKKEENRLVKIVTVNFKERITQHDN